MGTGAALILLACGLFLAIPDKGSEVEEMEEEKINPDLARLDERFLDKPGFAMEECRGVAINMACNCFS